MTVPPQVALTAEALLSRLSDHLDGLAADVHRVEQVVSGHATTARPTASAIVQLQSLDHLRQSLEDLSLLTLFLARPDSDGRSGLSNPACIRDRLRLGCTRALFDAPLPVTEQPSLAQSGDIDLF